MKLHVASLIQTALYQLLLKIVWIGMDSSAACLSADSISLCRILWHWQNLHNKPDVALNTWSALLL